MSIAKTSLFSFLLFHLVICVTYSQDNYRDGIDKILRYDLSIDTRKIDDFYIGIYTKGRWNHLNMSADSIATFGQYNEVPIGSLSKFITACKIHDLIKENKLKLNSTIDTILKVDDDDLSRISVGDLLAHRSGLPLQINRYLISASGKSNMELDRTDLINYLQKVDYDPTFVHFYNHTNYAILSLILSTINNDEIMNNPFYGSEGMSYNAHNIIPYVNECLTSDNEHPLYNVVNELTNLPETYATYGLLAQEVKRNYFTYMMTGRTAESRTVLIIDPYAHNAVIVIAPYEQDKYVDLALIIMRTITDNWKELKNGEKR